MESRLSWTSKPEPTIDLDDRRLILKIREVAASVIAVLVVDDEQLARGKDLPQATPPAYPHMRVWTTSFMAAPALRKTASTFFKPGFDLVSGLAASCSAAVIGTSRANGSGIPIPPRSCRKIEFYARQ
jgi:hypothetical protein